MQQQSTMELSWSQTPGKVWWALESGPSGTSLALDDLRTPSSPVRSLAGGSLKHDQSTIFYNYVDETDYKESEEQLSDWLKDYRTRGVIRVFQPGSTYSELIKCDIDTTAETVMAKCLAKELYVHYGSKRVRKVQLDEHPLQLQLRFLQELGHSNPHRMQLEGLKEDLPYLFKFVSGQESGKRPEDKVQLACPLRVKELNSTIPVWNKRFCVLCGSRMFIFASSHPRGKPTLVIDLQGGTIEEHKSKKYSYCLKITTSRGVVLLAFESRLEQSKWLERAGKIISKHPLEANLSGHSLERIPKYYFLNYNIIALNLAHNFMIESFEMTDAALLGQRKTIGWIDDISIFRHLVSLSLSDNCLEQFPLSLCTIASLQELDVSCNTIKTLPHEVSQLTRLTTLLLHSNQLTELPFKLKELQLLSTLVIAFNRFFELPRVVMELPVLRILVASGNYISYLPDDVAKMTVLQHLDVRFNKIRSKLPRSVLGMRNLVRLNCRGNGMSEINTAELLYLEFLNCSDNAFRSLSLNEGPITNLIARNNKIMQFSVPATCEQLMSIDLSRNELTSLPESLAQLEGLRKLDVSNNNLTKLPSKIFKMRKLEVLRVSTNRLITLPESISSECVLKVLQLHNNQLNSLPPQLFTNCKKLEVLNVSSNRLSSLPTCETEDTYNLVELYATCNSLRDSCFSTISSFRKIKVLHLAYNGLRNIPTGFFTGLKCLEYLNLSGNDFSALPPILGCPRLQCLILHSNKIHTLPSLPLLHQLHTLDLSCNQFESFPKLTSFPYLKFLDVSGNSSLVITKESVRTLRKYSSVSHGCMEGILDIDKTLAKDRGKFDVGGITTHGRWSYGSATVSGISSSTNCTAQVKAARLASRAGDGLFGVMDGGRSPKVPKALTKMLEKVLVEELSEQEKEKMEGYMDIDPLQYLTYTFLTAHRKLGEMGQHYGSSAVICHLRMLSNGSYELNVANTGLGEAILCRSGRAVPLTTPHSPSTNMSERTRVADTRGFVSQDNRVNGVCGTSRLLGVYHLWPQIIPIPSTESVELRTEDEYIVLATHSLWKHLTHEQVVHETKRLSDPIQAAKRLRDLAVAYGCRLDVSAIVVKLKVDMDPPPRPVHQLHQLQPLEALLQPELEEGEGEEEEEEREEEEEEEEEEREEEEEEEEEVGVTNIDDALSDDDAGRENAEDATSVTASPILPPMDTSMQDDMDRMVLSAIGPSPLADQPTMQSTNFDDLPLTDDSPQTPVPMDSTTSDLLSKAEAAATSGKPATGSSRPAVPSYQQQQQQQLDYEAQTLPKIASQARKSSGFTDLAETSFEQTQSVPTLQLKWSMQNSQVLSDPVSNHLVALNTALTRLDENTPFSSTPAAYQSIERPRKKGGRVVKRLSYVEHSYNKLTNDTYSSGSSSMRPVQASPDLDAWVMQQ